MIRRTLLEWGILPYGDGEAEIPPWAADRVAKVASASVFAGRHGGGVVEQGRKALRARGIVGVIASSDCALEILPKIEVKGDNGEATGQIRRRLVHMLASVLDLDIDVGKISEFAWQRESLLEILVRIFADKLIEAVRRGLPRHYIQQADDLPAIRGKLDVTRQFTKLAAEPSRLSCRYDALTADIPLNQVMRATVTTLARVTRSASNQRSLRELVFAYADISDLSMSAFRWEQVVLDRTNQRWRELFDLARLLLEGRFQTTTAGDSGGFSLLFEMNALFEEYVSITLKRVLAGTDLRVISQGGRLFCLENEEHRGLFQTRPDILIKRGEEVVQIIDTKWKKIANRIDDQKHGVAQGDVYQMMAYGQIYKCARLTLVYPHHTALHFDEGIQAVHSVTGSTARLGVATIDVARGAQIGQRLESIVRQQLAS